MTAEKFIDTNAAHTDYEQKPEFSVTIFFSTFNYFVSRKL